MNLRTPFRPEAILRAQRHASQHRAEITASAWCGCFHCLALFPPAAVTEWIDKDRVGDGQTALCPHCGVDAVLGTAAGFPLTTSFLTAMRGHWFDGGAASTTQPMASGKGSCRES